MDFKLLREALRQARHQAQVARKGVQRVGMTLKEAAAATGLNLSTIHSVENVKREPNLEPEFDTIERLVHAYGLTLSLFFARIEGLPEVDIAGQDREPLAGPVSPADETVPSLTAEELHTIRALTKVIRTSADREDEAAAAQSQRRANRRYAASPSRQQKAAAPTETGSHSARAARRRRLNKKVVRRHK